MDLHVLKQETPSHCASYLDQLFELYYRFLSIPADKFPQRYGSKYELRNEFENVGYHLHHAILLLRQLPPKTAVKLLQQITGKLTEKLNVEKRNHNLHSGKLEIPALRGANVLGILSRFYSDTDSNLPLINSIIGMAATYEETVSLGLIVHFAKKFVPAFFFLPLDYQENSLKIILGSILREDNPDKINDILDNSNIFFNRTMAKYNKSDLTASMQAGIDCIELFAARYQTASQTNPLMFQDPLLLFHQSDLSVFHFPAFMETLFNNPKISEAFAVNDLKAFLQLIPSTPNTGRFNDFGMITHSSAHGQGYNAWHMPLVELLKNSLKMANKDAAIKINYALLPCDAEHSQLAYEISDITGFADLESFLSLLIPGYHPRNPQQTGSGFFRMLPEVSLIHYRTMKSILVVDKMTGKNKHRILCLIYVRLAVTWVASILYAYAQARIEEGKEVSRFKFTRWLKDMGNLKEALCTGDFTKLLDQLDRDLDLLCKAIKKPVRLKIKKKFEKQTCYEKEA